MSSRLDLGSTQPPIQRVPGTLSLGVKRQWREADHLPPASAEVKKCGSVYPLRLHRVVLNYLSTGTTLPHMIFFFFNGSSNPFKAWPLIQFRKHFSQTAGFLGRVISPSQVLNAGQYKHRNVYTHQTSSLKWYSNRRPSVRASEDSLCLRQRGYRN
jgi:hypothetical protein